MRYNIIISAKDQKKKVQESSNLGKLKKFLKTAELVVWTYELKAVELSQLFRVYKYLYKKCWIL